MTFKLVKWDVLKHMQKEELQVIDENEVALVCNEDNMIRYQISTNKYGELIIYKTGFPDDRISVISEGANRINLKT